MTFLAPGFLVAAAVAAAAIVALHFLSTREPKLELLPTTRFLPDMPVRATATTLRPTDLWLLLLRVLLVLLVGAALARPVLTPERQSVARIVAVDVSRAVGDVNELVDSMSSYLPAVAVIVFDSAARLVSDGALDSLPASVRTAGASQGEPVRGSLSAALIAARRAAARVRDRADSLDLVVISPFAAEEHDAATANIRGLWPGRITTVAVQTAVSESRSDSVLVEWADSAAGSLWNERTPADTVTAVRAGDAVLIHPFVRRWRLADQSDARVIARWADGAPAAVEIRTESGQADDAADGNVGCVRSFGFALPAEGDVVLRPEFQRFVGGLTSPCGGARDFAPLPAPVMASLQGEGSLAPASAIDPRVQRATPFTPWLLLIGAVLAVLELFVRGRSGRKTYSASDPVDSTDSPARAA